MNLYEQIERYSSSPLDQQRVILGAMSRLADMLDNDAEVAKRSYQQNMLMADLKASLDGMLTNTSGHRAAILKALFMAADSADTDSGLTSRVYRSRLETLYQSPLMERHDSISECRVILTALEIVCEILDVDGQGKDFHKTVFEM